MHLFLYEKTINNNAYFYLNMSSSTIIINKIIMYYYITTSIKAKIQNMINFLEKKNLGL